MERIRNFFGRIWNRARKLPRTKRERIRAGVTRSREFLGRKWRTIRSNLVAIRRARRVNINLRIRVISQRLWRNLRRRESGIITRMNRQVRRFGWKVERIRERGRVIPLFTSTRRIRFALIRTSSPPVTIPLKAIVVLLATVGVIVIGIDIIVRGRLAYQAAERIPTPSDVRKKIELAPEEERADLVREYLDVIEDVTPPRPRPPILEQIRGNIGMVIIGIVVIFVIWFAVKTDAPGVIKRKIN